MKKVTFVIYIIFIHIVLISILIKPEFVHTATYKLGIYPSPLHYERLLAGHLLKNSRIQEGDIVFLGDSIMEKTDISQITNKGHNLGISKDWTQGLADRIPLYRTLDRASTLMVHIGINDLSLRKGEAVDCFSRYQHMLSLLPENIPVVLNSVLPLGGGKDQSEADNSKIEKFNQLIRQYAESRPNYYYLDIASHVKDENGALKAEYHIYDFIHLNKQGYAVFIQVIHDFLAQNQLL
ncbi:GDSL-type esterase/lipase family protein [Candidatus Albibeggiatoa sp. nov. NOAA]|uniref:GDSL-type esterase/lipase family protein n=1 Tax=Candidatus Albibeggiatoa sp. nov. NOAA TaxID=3162724 RepID=UPI0032F85321|nr:GDSL-type esterase/lipase family protein [Thiotrichaceae bacterium]